MSEGDSAASAANKENDRRQTIRRLIDHAMVDLQQLDKDDQIRALAALAFLCGVEQELAEKLPQ
jgi:hypothetical protein